MALHDITSKYRRADFEEPSSGTEAEEPDTQMSSSHVKVNFSEKASNEASTSFNTSQNTPGPSNSSVNQQTAASHQITTDPNCSINRAYLRNLSSSTPPEFHVGEPHPILALDQVFPADDQTAPIITASSQNSPAHQSPAALCSLNTVHMQLSPSHGMAEVEFHQRTRFNDHLCPFLERGKRFVYRYPFVFCLFFLVFLSIVLLLILFFTSFTLSSGFKPAKLPETCVTKDCIIASADLLRSIDPHVDPCDDFYSFVCGQRLRTAQIPPGQSKWTSFSDLGFSLTNAARDLLERPPAPNESLSVTHTRSFYQACVNETRVEELHAEPLFHLLDVWFARPLNATAAPVALANDSFGRFCRAFSQPTTATPNPTRTPSAALPRHGWYLLNEQLVYLSDSATATDNASDSDISLAVSAATPPDARLAWLCAFDWSELLSRLEDYNIEPFYDLDVSQDLKNSTRNMLQVCSQLLEQLTSHYH